MPGNLTLSCMNASHEEMVLLVVVGASFGGKNLKNDMKRFNNFKNLN